jgi:hypothetical protein
MNIVKNYCPALTKKHNYESYRHSFNQAMESESEFVIAKTKNTCPVKRRWSQDLPNYSSQFLRYSY